MREFRQRQQWKKIVYSRWSVLVLIIISTFMVQAVWHAYIREQGSLTDSLRAQDRLKALQSRAAVLQANVTDLQTPEGIDRQVRQKFNVVKAGENVALIVGAPTTTATTSADDTLNTSNQSWWQKIW